MIPEYFNNIPKGILGRSNEIHDRMTVQSPQNSFNLILRNELSGLKAPEASKGEASSITKEQLKILLHAIQVQMNMRLFSAFLGNMSEANDLATQVIQKFAGSFQSQETSASKKCQTLPKKDQTDVHESLEKMIQEASVMYNVDAKLIESVIKVESNSDPSATSPKGAMGLMQLMPDTARELGVKNPYDARENIMGGTRYLKTLLDRYNGQVDLALAAYNWGMGNLEKKPHNIPRETLDYIAKVNSYYKSV